ncbi:fumarylacetoacetate hydrolase family protein [Plastorhodobacter daqingensis]|uniref:Fumarylacetoacetate hydrolase family protein n=1 Tax=Plastorhodobacter daqingensis TaxID=1387281 RepID=A0ABW2UIA5_9RHOB
MRLASFQHEGTDTIGIEAGGKLYPLDDLWAAMGRKERFSDMRALIEAGAPALEAARAAAHHLEQKPEGSAGIDPEAVRWHPPVRRPYKICGIAMNNSASDSRKISAPDHPLFFLKPASSLVGHNEPIVVRDDYGSVHPEPELAVIIAETCRDVPVEEAMRYVFGYTILNDMTGNGMRAEDRVHYYALYPRADDPDQLERREQHLSYTARYKGTDTFGPMGPYLVTPDEVPDPHALDVRCWHNDDLIADDSTAYYTYSIPEIISFVSRYHSLWPGDVISLGTAFRPSAGQKRSLHTADVTSRGGAVSIEITGLGRLHNPVRKV